MTDAVVLRHATLDDLPVIVDIYNSTIPSRMVTADTEPVSVRDRLDWFHAHNPERRPLWIAELGGAVCGWAGLQDFFYRRPAYHATAEVSIYLHEAFRGKGLGKQILAKVMAECPRLASIRCSPSSSGTMSRAFACSRGWDSRSGPISRELPSWTASSAIW